MKEFKYVITDPEGIHARPAGLLVKEAAKYKSAIKIGKDGKEVDCKRLLALMSLGVKKDQEVVLTFEGEDEEEAFAAVSSFLQENL